MKPTTITLVFGLLCSFLSFGINNEEEKSSIRKTQNREFSIQCGEIKDRNEASSVPDVKVKIEATYISKENNIEVKFYGIPLTLDYPLDFEVFASKFDSTFVAQDGNKDKYVKHRSHLEIFYWIVRIKDDNNQPIAGKLSLAQYVKVTSGKSSKHSDRMKAVALMMDQNNRLQSERSQHEAKIQQVTKYIKELKEVSPAEQADKSDSVFVKWYAENNTDIKKLLEGIKYDENEISIYDSLYGIIEKVLTTAQSSLSSTQNKYSSKIDELQSENIYKVTNVSVQFERGFIERIQVSLNYPQYNRQEIFENNYPIGFTSIANFADMSGIKIYKRTNKYEFGEDAEYIYLSDIIEMYDNKLDLLTKDYSPGDTTISVNPSSEPICILNKESSMYIIEAKTFTDFNGFNEDSPNGLVQIELSREFNLLSYRYQIRNWGNVGFANYVVAQANFLKLENKLKGLPLRNEMTVENSTIVSPSYATNLDFKRYESISLNLDANLLLFDVPDLKTTVYFDLVGHYGYTPIIDSNYQVVDDEVQAGETKRLDAHNFAVSPKVTIQLFAERRFGMKLSYLWNNNWLFTNNRFKQVVSYSGKGQDLTTFSTNPDAQRHHTLEAFMFFDPDPTSKKGKVFAVARFHFQHRDINTFFPQILLGYAFQLFK